MKKFVIAVLGAGLMLALTAGTASAQVGTTCPDNSSSDPDPRGGVQVYPPGGIGGVYADGADTRVGGELAGVGFGQADPSISDTDVTYSGQTNGEDAGLGYGEIENGSAGTSGVSGSAHGDAPLGLAKGEGSVDSNEPALNAKFEVNGGNCQSVDLP